MKLLRLTLCAFVILLLGAGCLVVRPRDPLPVAQGWRQLLAREYTKLDPMITEDYKNYISELPKRERMQITESSIHYCGNTNGQHAVFFETGRPGFLPENVYAHILIYDENNKRIKVMHYKNRESLCSHSIERNAA